MSAPTPKDIFTRKELEQLAAEKEDLRREELDPELVALLDKLKENLARAKEPSFPPSEKKPFVRKPHLTQRALRDHPDLTELKKSLSKPKKDNT